MSETKVLSPEFVRHLQSWASFSKKYPDATPDDYDNAWHLQFKKWYRTLPKKAVEDGHTLYDGRDSAVRLYKRHFLWKKFGKTKGGKK